MPPKKATLLKPAGSGDVLMLEVLSTLNRILSLLTVLGPEHLVKKWEANRAKCPDESDPKS